MTKRIDLEYTPQPKQELLHRTRARLILYGGAAGGGKSKAIRCDAVDFCIQNPGLQAFLFRRTLTELEQNHITPIRQELGEMVGRYNHTKNRYEFHNGANLNFCYAEHAGDEQRYQGAEIHWLGVDEAGLFDPEQLAFLISRVRLGSFEPREGGLLPRILFASNPGGPSHMFLKDTFVDPAVPGALFTDEMTGWKAIFIPAKIDDNKYIDETYAAQFSRMPLHKQRMYRDGDWDVIAGAFFDCFDRQRHVVRPFRIPDHWMKFRALDWGHATPFSVGWWAVSDGCGVVDKDGSRLHLPAGALVRYREWYGAIRDKNGRPTNQGLRLDAEQVADGIKGRTNEKVTYTVAPQDMAKTDHGPSQYEKMSRAGIPLVLADRQREPGWQEMYQRLLGEDEPMLYVFDTCTDFIRTVPVLLADEKNLEDVAKGPHDHIADESRYACMSRPWVRGEEKPVPKKTGWEFMELVKQARTSREERVRI